LATGAADKMGLWRALLGTQESPHSVTAQPASDAATPLQRVSTTGVPYRLERVRRRSIGLVITTDGLVIRAPMWTPIYEIEAAIAERQGWIESATRRQRVRLAQLAEVRDGGHILFRGNKLPIELRHGPFETIDLGEQHCVVCSPTGQVSRLRLDEEIKRIAKAVLPRVAREMADAASLPLRAVRLSTARTLWGSCTIDGNVRLNFRLIQLPSALMRHVIAHELAHLVEFNHSKRFWSIVESLDPASKTHRRAVKNYAVLLEL
jgi:predicted metal-dependent hydrolase